MPISERHSSCKAKMDNLESVFLFIGDPNTWKWCAVRKWMGYIIHLAERIVAWNACVCVCVRASYSKKCNRFWSSVCVYGISYIRRARILLKKDGNGEIVHIARHLKFNLNRTSIYGIQQIPILSHSGWHLWSRTGSSARSQATGEAKRIDEWSFRFIANWKQLSPSVRRQAPTTWWAMRIWQTTLLAPVS